MKTTHKLFMAVAGSTFAIVVAIACGSDRPSTSGGGISNPPQAPCLEGAERACHETVSIHNGVLTCRTGTQKCVNGGWNACGSSGDVEITARQATPGQLSAAGLTSTGDLSTQHSCRGRGRRSCRDGGTAPPLDGGQCDPCDPGCVSIYDDAGSLQLDGSLACGEGGVPGSALSSAYCDLQAGGLGGHPSWSGAPSCSGGSTCSTGTSQICQHDMYCNGSSLRCTPYAPGQIGPCNSAGQWDMQMSIGCWDPALGWRISVCNRGIATSPTGLSVGYHNGPPNGTPGSCPFPDNTTTRDGVCSGITVPALAGGACYTFTVDATSCPGLAMSGLNLAGDTTLAINNVSPGWTPYNAGECNNCNNYGAIRPSANGPAYVQCVAGAPPWFSSGCQVNFDQVPPGQVADMIHDDPSGGCTGPDASVVNNGSYNDECEHWPSGSKSGGLYFSACQGDTFCLPGEVSGSTSPMVKKCCQRFRNGTTHATYGVTNCIGPDITAGGICRFGGTELFPICNRGNTVVPPGTPIYVAVVGSGALPGAFAFLDAGFGGGCGPPNNCYSVPATQPSSCYPQIGSAQDKASEWGDPACTFIVGDAGLSPGECVPHSCVAPTGPLFSGTKKVYVNARAPDGGPPSVLECPAIEMPGMMGQVVQPGCANNWTATPSSTFNCPVQYTVKSEPISYSAACNPGYHPQWKNLVWTGTVPSNGSGTSSIVFEAQTAAEYPDGGYGPDEPATPVVIGRAVATAYDLTTNEQPGNCLFNGPSPDCPRDLYALFGGKPVATNESLELTITLNPTPDKTLTPTLSTWTLTYSCVAAE